MLTTGADHGLQATMRSTPQNKWMLVPEILTGSLPEILATPT
jgi:hypothetical protein